jgi:hypothetical protein
MNKKIERVKYFIKKFEQQIAQMEYWIEEINKKDKNHVVINNWKNLIKSKQSLIKKHKNFLKECQ